MIHLLAPNEGQIVILRLDDYFSHENHCATSTAAWLNLFKKIKSLPGRTERGS